MTASAFDTYAASYDDVASSALGVVLRSRVHRALRTVISSRSKVVDLGCGTGIDAAWLSPRVGSILAFDLSLAMVELARERCADLDNVTVEHGDAAASLDELDTESVDVVLSNFGVVNCVGNLDNLHDSLQRIMRPGAHAVLVPMGGRCPIELMKGIAGRNTKLVNRRKRASDAHLQYYSPASIAEAFAAGFEMVHAEALGLALPPFEQRGWVEGRTALRKTLTWADDHLAKIGARTGLGDHHIVVLRRHP